MSKELEGLERIKVFFKVINQEKLMKEKKVEYCYLKPYIDYLNIIEKALQRLEAIDQSNPSEALEYLEKFFNSRKIYEPNNTVIFDCITCINSIKQSLLEFKSLDLSLRLPSEQSSSHFTYKDKNLVCMQSTKYSKLMNVFLEYEKYQEQEKVLNILKEKNVNIFQLRLCNTLDEYNARPKEERLTEEEFDLLKRYFNEKI